MNQRLILILKNLKEKEAKQNKMIIMKALNKN